MFKTKRIFSKTLILMLVVALSVGIVGCTKEASQQEAPKQEVYPSKAVELIVPWPAGSGSDAQVRLVFSYAEKYFGQKFVILNKEGASGEVGWTYISQAKPDGYTIGLLNSPLLQMPIQKTSTKFTLDSFSYIANLITDPGVVCVKTGGKYKNLTDLIADAKARPEKVTIGCAGLLTSEARTIKNLESMAGVKFNLVPYNGGGELNAALLGGHIDAIATNVGSQMSMILDKSMTPIAVAAAQKVSLIPDVPTFKEQGYDIEQVSMRAIGGPAGMDPSITAKIYDAIQKAMNDPELNQKLKDMNLPTDLLSGDKVLEIYKNIDKNLRAEWAVRPWA